MAPLVERDNWFTCINCEKSKDVEQINSLRLSVQIPPSMSLAQKKSSKLDTDNEKHKAPRISPGEHPQLEEPHNNL